MSNRRVIVQIPEIPGGATPTGDRGHSYPHHRWGRQECLPEWGNGFVNSSGKYGGARACLFGVCTVIAVMLIVGCGANMRNQPKYTAYQESQFFDNDSADRYLPNGVVPAGTPALSGTSIANTSPPPVTKQLLERGQVEYKIACVPCHGASGYGDGMIVRRGFTKPPSFHIERLREAPDQHFYDVITNGYGAMPSYGYMVSPRDRWAIITYIRALQLSQHAPVQLVPTTERGQLSGGQG